MMNNSHRGMTHKRPFFNNSCHRKGIKQMPLLLQAQKGVNYLIGEPGSPTVAYIAFNTRLKAKFYFTDAIKYLALPRRNNNNNN